MIGKIFLRNEIAAKFGEGRMCTVYKEMGLHEGPYSVKLTRIPSAERKPSRCWIWAIAVALLLLAGCASRQVKVLPQSSLKPVLLTSDSGIQQPPSFSPDGSKVAFSWNGGTGFINNIYILPIGSAETPMRLTTSPMPEVSPAWSPDDQWIAFVRFQQTSPPAIMLISPLGGTERKLAEILTTSTSLSWTPDAKWLVYSAPDSLNALSSIWAISIETGESRRLIKGAGASGDSYPSISPDGQTLAFARTVKTNVAELYTLRLTKDLNPDGDPAKVTDKTYQSVWGIAWTAEGREIIYSAGDFMIPSLWRVSASGRGKPERVQFAQPGAIYPAVARRQPRLMYTRMTYNVDLWRADMGTNQRSIFNGSSYLSLYPEYSPDVSKVAFCSNRSGETELWVCDANGTNPVQLTRLGNSGGSPHWSPDGRWLAFDTYAEGQGEIYLISADGGTARNMTNNPNTEINPSWSRDGKWIYFTSDRSGRFEIWKMPKDGGEAVQITRSGGYRASESLDGTFIYYGKSQGLGLFRMPAAGGQETEVASEAISSFPFAVTQKGIHFIGLRDQRTIMLLDPGTGDLSTLVTLDSNPLFGCFAISPDDAYIVWSQMNKNIRDLMLVEGFR